MYSRADLEAEPPLVRLCPPCLGAFSLCLFAPLPDHTVLHQARKMSFYLYNPSEKGVNLFNSEKSGPDALKGTVEEPVAAPQLAIASLCC